MTFFLQNGQPERIRNRDFYLHMFSSKKLINEFLKNKDETFLADPYKLHETNFREKKIQNKIIQNTREQIFLVFETITRTYLFQLALEIMRWRLAI